MMNITDQMLSAFIDGELPEDEMGRLAKEIDSDPALAKRIRSLKTVDTALTDAITGLVDDPVPAHILDMVGAHKSETSSNVVEFRSSSSRAWFGSPMAVAAAAAFGLGVGMFFDPAPSSERTDQIYAGLVDPASNLHSVLNTVPSNSSKYDLTPVLSFETKNGGVCREVLGDAARALACREGNNWTVLAVTHDVRIQQSDTYETASANASIVFDILAQDLMIDAPMSASKEEELIGKNWRLTPLGPEQ